MLFASKNLPSRFSNGEEEKCLSILLGKREKLLRPSAKRIKKERNCSKCVKSRGIK
jgi:hypothetical protein